VLLHDLRQPLPAAGPNLNSSSNGSSSSSSDLESGPKQLFDLITGTPPYIPEVG
jgi:hypothetical protein